MGISVFEQDVTFCDDAVCTQVYPPRLPSCFKVLHSEVPYKIQRKDEVNVICTYLGALLRSQCRTVPSSFIFLSMLGKRWAGENAKMGVGGR